MYDENAIFYTKLSIVTRDKIQFLEIKKRIKKKKEELIKRELIYIQFL